MEIVDVRNQLARHPSKIYSKRKTDVIKYLVIHHSATNSGDAFSFARYHVNNHDWPGIGYHYVILEDGTVQWTNNIEVTSYHVKEHNSYSVGICIVGNFTKDVLNTKQKEAVKELVGSLMAQLNLSIERIVGHSEINHGATQCPALDMDALRQYISTEHVEVFVNDDKLNIPAQLKNGVTYVPIRPLGEALGYEVEWDANKEQVYLFKDDLSKETQEANKYYLSIINKIKNIISGV